MEDETVEIKKHQLEELRFYGFAGICIIRFQQAQDYLEIPFAKLLAASPDRSALVFDAIRTVARRCKVIGGLIETARPELAEQWKGLTRRILQAETSRDSIAHGSPVFGGGATTIQVDQTTDTATVLHQTQSFYYLEKCGSDDWTTERLLDEARRMEALLSDLYAFGRSLDALHD